MRQHKIGVNFSANKNAVTQHLTPAAGEHANGTTATTVTSVTTSARALTNWQALSSIARKSHCAANGRNLRPAEFSMGPTN